MPHKTPQNSINEHELAQLLSGTLDEDSRLSVLSRLAADPEARTVLRMALQALEAAETAHRSPARRVA